MEAVYNFPELVDLILTKPLEEVYADPLYMTFRENVTTCSSFTIPLYTLTIMAEFNDVDRYNMLHNMSIDGVYYNIDLDTLNFIDINALFKGFLEVMKFLKYDYAINIMERCIMRMETTVDTDLAIDEMNNMCMFDKPYTEDIVCALEGISI